MMTVRRVKNDVRQDRRCFTGSSSPEKQTTPFSIDDILSNSKRFNSKSTHAISKTLRCFPTQPQHLSNFCPNFLVGNQSIYQRWFESLQQLCISTSFHPMWLSSSSTKFFSENVYPSAYRSHAYRHAQPQPQKKKMVETPLSELPSQKEMRKRKLSDSSSTSRKFTDSPDSKFSVNQKNGDCLTRVMPHQNDDDRKKLKKSPDSDSPLSALEKLTCTTFRNMEDKQNILHTIAAGRETKVKRRKCRTAFTTFQLSILEQRFKCHKYLTPTDRDQIAHILGLSAPQVITWFQNRRAKQKRDQEELKNDIKTVKKWTEEQSSTAEVESSFSPIKNDDENNELTDVDVESC